MHLGRVTKMKEQNSIQEDLIFEQQRENLNEIDDGAFETWKSDNFNDLLQDFSNDYLDLFGEYCKDRWDEIQAEKL